MNYNFISIYGLVQDKFYTISFNWITNISKCYSQKNKEFWDLDKPTTTLYNTSTTSAGLSFRAHMVCGTKRFINLIFPEKLANKESA